MLNILVTNTYFYYFDKKQWRAKRPYPPLGSLYASAVLKQADDKVHFFDNCLEKNTNAFKEEIRKNKIDVLVIYDDGFNYLTKMCLTVMREAAMEMGQFAKKMGILTIISSSDSTDHASLYLENGFDYVILGEGEDSLKDLVSAISEGRSKGEVKGIAYLSDGKLVSNRGREIIRTIDDLPDPSWDLLDISPYRKIWMENHGYFSLNISTTRGCPYKCNWCAKPIYGNRYNSRSPERVVNEMMYLQDAFGVDEFWITDDIFGLKPGWVQSFNEIIQKENRQFNYKIQSRADLMLKDNNLTAMVDSGLSEVWIGAESGSQKVLDAMDKGITVEQIRQVTEKIKARDRKICFFLQFGYLGEEKEDIEKTVEMMLDLMPHDIGISVSYPLPGTGFYEKVKNQLVDKANWTDSDDLDVMYEAPYSKAYYRKLHRRVHKLYRRKQGLQNLDRLFKNLPKLNNVAWKSIVLSLFYYTPSLMINRIFHGSRS